MRESDNRSILIIDTSYYSGFSVSVLNNSNFTSLSFLGSEPNFTRIWDLIDIALNSFGVTKEDIGVLAVSRGPGPFSAVRTGITVAKTLREIKKINVITFSVFDVLSSEFENSYFFVDGRAKKFIVGDNSGQIKILRFSELEEFVNMEKVNNVMKRFVSVGCQGVLKELVSEGSISRTVYDSFSFYDILPVTWVRDFVLRKFELGEFDDKLEPIYVS
jgi:tRNA A37 threonylcarbamoyladenosine modification protein TsaB